MVYNNGIQIKNKKREMIKILKFNCMSDWDFEELRELLAFQETKFNSTEQLEEIEEGELWSVSFAMNGTLVFMLCDDEEDVNILKSML